MKNLKLGTQLNISFALVLFVPMIVATLFSIRYYSNKIQEEAVNTISSDLKTADIIYQNSIMDMKHLATAYAQKKVVTVLLSLDLGEKLGNDLAKSAQLDDLDMITVTDTSGKVLVRSHAPKKIHDLFPLKNHILKAFSGSSLSGTEILNAKDLMQEGFTGQPREGNILTMSGVAPVYDRQREHIIGAIVVRRVLDSESEVVKRICENLNISAALFEHVSLIASCTASKEEREFIPPPLGLLRDVLAQNTSVHIAEIQKRGSISKYQPIQDFNGDPVGILMVQTGVESYLLTRQTAINNLIIIFLVGVILAFTIKTIIGRRIIIPVQRLRKGVERIGSGDYTHLLRVTSMDEIGDLTVAFNAMAEELNKYDEQLKAYNQQLEDRVRERTSELQIANEQLIHANTILEDTMERLNPGVSRLIGNNKQRLGLVYATELVADICNYTKLNMILGETMMGEFMTKFFRESHKLLAKYRGMFDKTVGDQVVAIFGTPKDHSPANEIHPFDAILCALKMVEVTEKINEVMQLAIQDNYSAIANRHNSLSSEDRESVKIEDLRFQCRIGINTSNPASDREIDRMRMVMMGAETCIDYTAQGGSIIYAFRLESTGTPGEIHIGENSKRLVEHIHLLEELPHITLKGLGIQPGYRVAGCRSVFENIYPATRFYQSYADNVPEDLLRLVADMKIARIQIQEVRKISEHLDVDIPYLEHLSGLYKLSMARALFCHAVGESLGLDTRQLQAVIFASLWHNSLGLRDALPEPHEIYEIGTQVPDTWDTDLVGRITDSLEQARPEGRDQDSDIREIQMLSDIIAMCEQFDHMVFDRTYLRTRTRDIVSAKEVFSLMKLEEKFDDRLIRALEELMVAQNGESCKSLPDSCKTEYLPGNPAHLAAAIRERLSREQQEELLRLLE